MAKLVNLDRILCWPYDADRKNEPFSIDACWIRNQLTVKGNDLWKKPGCRCQKAKAIAERTPDNISYMLIGQDADKIQTF